MEDAPTFTAEPREPHVGMICLGLMALLLSLLGLGFRENSMHVVYEARV